MYRINQAKIVALVGESGMKTKCLAAKLNITPRTMSRKMLRTNGDLWTGAELAALAGAIHATPADFFSFTMPENCLDKGGGDA